jgi:uncharacterized protein (TIGR02246 family)
VDLWDPHHIIDRSIVGAGSHNCDEIVACDYAECGSDGGDAMRRLIILATIFVLGFTAGRVLADAADEVMQADRDFAKLAQEKGVPEAFAAYAAPDAHWFVPGPEPLRGPEAIKARLAKSFAKGGTLEWAPTRAWASADGTMAVTWGRSVYTSPKDASGKTSVSSGSYLSVWMRQPDGRWKFSHDMGTTDPEPKKP